MQSYSLTLPNPTNVHHLVSRVAQSSHAAFYRVREGRLGRVLDVRGHARFVEFGLHPVQPDTLEIIIHNGCPEDEDAVTRKIIHLLALDTDLAQFYAHCSNDQAMSSIVSKVYGARMLRDADVFSSIISSIISQQINLKFAATLKQRLWCMAGEEVVVDGEPWYADPKAEAVAKLNYEDLRQCQYTQRKAEYVVDVARLVACGSLDLTSIAQLEDEEFIEKLCQVRGLGRWTAECVLLFGLGRQDLLPAKDVGLQKAVTTLWRLPERITAGELRQRAEAWKPWSSWYTYYLWLSLAKDFGKDA